MLPNLRLSRKLLIAFTTVVSVVLIFSWIAFSSLSDIKVATSDNAHTQDILRRGNDLLSNLVESQNAMRGYVASVDPSFLTRIENYKNQTPAILDDLERLLSSGAASTTTQPLRAAIDVFNGELADTTVAAADPLRLAETRASVSEIARLTPTRALLTQLIEGEEALASERAERSAEAFDTAMRTLLAGGILTAIISVALGILLSRSVAVPVRAITHSMKNLAGGDADTAIPYAGRTDEIGEMAAAVEIFRINAVERRRLEDEAGRLRNQTEEQRRRTAEQDRIRAEAMAQATSGLADGLKQLAAGNLGFQLSQSFAEEFESLRSDFNQAVLQLKDTMTSVSEATGAIDSGSREVSHSADDLSKRTEQQAASLEETAAALDQITTNVANSSKRAEEARTVAIQANQNATQSGQVVANAVDAMGKIEQSSNQISNIIGVIDDIAFQTNLLALNAGVEAARAGEAGKGFAVVAQEVRELAQRSATAAKEIKDLIRNSSVEVANGVQLVSQTGEALKTIEAYIVTINQHMDAIATSSREQSVGLNEVNTAVNQMDQVTQQNAAMVEEANAAGATLASEASRLRELIGQFDLGRGSTPAAAHRSTGSVMAARPNSAPAHSPARSMVGKIAKAFGGGRTSAAAAPSTESWEEF